MFNELLESITSKVEGTLGAIVMGMDGISIEKRLPDDTNIEVLAAEYTSLLKASSAAAQEIGQGPLEEVARTLEISPAAAKSRIYRAARKLRSDLTLEEVF